MSDNVQEKVKARDVGFHFFLYFLGFFFLRVQASTLQSLEYNQVAVGMQERKGYDCKSATEEGLTASRRTKIKVKQRSSVTRTFFVSTSYLIFQRKGS